MIYKTVNVRTNIYSTVLYGAIGVW